MGHDCLSCGACCRAEPGYGGGVYVRLQPGDLERLAPGEVEALVRPAPDGARALRLIEAPGGHRTCAALQGELGRSVCCAIYERRPASCRAFQVDTPECALARQEAGLSP